MGKKVEEEDKSPDYTLKVFYKGVGTIIGSGWKKKGANGDPFISIKINAKVKNLDDLKQAGWMLWEIDKKKNRDKVAAVRMEIFGTDEPEPEYESEDEWPDSSEDPPPRSRPRSRR